MSILRAQAKIEHEPAAPLIEDAIEGGAKGIAIERVEDIEPARRGCLERTALEPE